MAKQTIFKIDNSDFRNKSKKMMDDFPNFMGYFLKRVGLRLLAKVKRLTPVDTGLLRKSWRIKKPVISSKEGSIEIYNNVKYAKAVEMGIYKSKHQGIRTGRFMLKRSLLEMEEQMQSFLENDIKTFINKFGGSK